MQYQFFPANWLGRAETVLAFSVPGSLPSKSHLDSGEVKEPDSDDT